MPEHWLKGVGSPQLLRGPGGLSALKGRDEDPRVQCVLSPLGRVGLAGGDLREHRVCVTAIPAVRADQEQAKVASLVCIGRNRVAPRAAQSPEAEAGLRQESGEPRPATCPSQPLRSRMCMWGSAGAAPVGTPHGCLTRANHRFSGFSQQGSGRFVSILTFNPAHLLQGFI